MQPYHLCLVFYCSKCCGVRKDHYRRCSFGFSSLRSGFDAWKSSIRGCPSWLEIPQKRGREESEEMVGVGREKNYANSLATSDSPYRESPHLIMICPTEKPTPNNEDDGTGDDFNYSENLG
eukprot:jgi/Bigna1/144840/aug1.92_g19548